MERQEVHNINEKANSFSFRYAGVGHEAKLYFETLNDLKNGIDAVIEAHKYLQQKLAEISALEVSK